MALVAYTSAAINPTVDPLVDAVITQAALPATAQLYGGALDSLDLLPALTYVWTILEKPAGSAVVFQDTLGNTSTLANPVLQDIDTWENIRVMLVCTNTNNASVSEADPLLAPDSAFVQARVTSTTLTLQKLAYGERNHKPPWNEVVAALESMAAAGFVLPAEWAALVSGGYAEWPLANSLHMHKGPDVDVATYGGDQGTVYLADPPVNPATPQALGIDYHPMTVLVSSTPTTTGRSDCIEVADVAIGAAKYPHALFHVRAGCTLESFSVHFADFGDLTNTYDFEVWHGPAADWYAGAALVHHVAFDFTLGPAAADNATFGAESPASTLGLATGDIVGLFVAAAPSTFLGDRPGTDMTVTAHMYRKV